MDLFGKIELRKRDHALVRARLDGVDKKAVVLRSSGKTTKTTEKLALLIEMTCREEPERVDASRKEP